MLITALISYIKHTESMKFYTDIKPNSLKCVGEYLIENTLALFSIKNGNTENVIRLLDPNGNTAYKKENLDVVKLAYTAKDSGNHQLCIHNNIDKAQRVEIEILTGVAAQDYSSIAKQSNLKPMELNVRLTSIIIIYFIYLI